LVDKHLREFPGFCAGDIMAVEFDDRNDALCCHSDKKLVGSGGLVYGE